MRNVLQTEHGAAQDNPLKLHKHQLTAAPSQGPLIALTRPPRTKGSTSYNASGDEDAVYPRPPTRVIRTVGR
jgi:hypothetical protein